MQRNQARYSKSSPKMSLFIYLFASLGEEGTNLTITIGAASTEVMAKTACLNVMAAI